MPKKQKSLQEKTLTFRVEADFAAKVEAAAADRGINKSAFIRAALEAQINGKPVPRRKPLNESVNPEAIRQLTALKVELNHQGNNLNQLTTEAHKGGIHDIASAAAGLLEKISLTNRAISKKMAVL